MKSYVLMYVDRDTGEETREVQVYYTDEEVEEVTKSLEEQYDNVEVMTTEEADRLGLEY
jgi:hypothetical protein